MGVFRFVVVLSGYDVIRTALVDQSLTMAGRPDGVMTQFINSNNLGDYYYDWCNQ